MNNTHRKGDARYWHAGKWLGFTIWPDGDWSVFCLGIRVCRMAGLAPYLLWNIGPFVKRDTFGLHVCRLVFVPAWRRDRTESEARYLAGKLVQSRKP